MSLRMYVNQTRMMVFNKKETNGNYGLSLNEKPIDQVNEFVHLGRMFTINGRIDREIDRKVLEGKWLVVCWYGVVEISKKKKS